jgi:hypothetical protein
MRSSRCGGNPLCLAAPRGEHHACRSPRGGTAGGEASDLPELWCLLGTMRGVVFSRPISRVMRCSCSYSSKPLLHAPYSDCLSRNQTLCVCSPEAILAEKLCALLRRTEPRELYDVHHILEYGLSDARAVSQRVSEKMTHNNVSHSKLAGALICKHESLRRLWEPRLQGYMPDLPNADVQFVRSILSCAKRALRLASCLEPSARHARARGGQRVKCQVLLSLMRSFMLASPIYDRSPVAKDHEVIREESLSAIFSLSAPSVR